MEPQDVELPDVGPRNGTHLDEACPDWKRKGCCLGADRGDAEAPTSDPEPVLRDAEPQGAAQQISLGARNPHPTA